MENYSRIGPDEFFVKFGNKARTLVYNDAQGECVFTFDVGSSGGKSIIYGGKSICLEHHSARTQAFPRYRTAFERTKQYLESIGYKVEIFGDFAPPLTMKASDVSKLIQTEIDHCKQFPSLGFDLKICLIPPTFRGFKFYTYRLAWNPIYDLWLVLEEPRHQLRIVFDEYTGRFGVAEKDNFIGFYGNFIDTLDALIKYDSDVAPA